MAKRSINSRESILEDISPLEETSPVNSSEVGLQLLMDIRLNIVGSVTGRTYSWNRAGDIVYVDAEDAEIIKNKKSGRTCCGSPSASYFAVV